MVYRDTDFLFDFLDMNLSGFLTAVEIRDYEESIHFDEALDIHQIDAAMHTVCECLDGVTICHKAEFTHLLNELERRREVDRKVKWDFRALDLEGRGKITLQDTLFLFKVVHNQLFSIELWKQFLSSRLDPFDDVTFGEVRLFLCNLVRFNPSTKDEFLQEFAECNKKVEDQQFQLHQNLLAWQDEGTSILTRDQEKKKRYNRIRSAAGHLLNRIGESGPQVLLQDEEDDGLDLDADQPIDRVGATLLLDALKKKHDVLREKLLSDMLRIHVGEGMWAAFSEREQQERVLKLKAQEEQHRKEGKIETVASSLPGAKHQCPYSLLALMGESSAEDLVTRQAVAERVRESGKPQEEVEKEFTRSRDEKYAMVMTTDELLLALNERMRVERDILSLRLQGLNGFATMLSVEREEFLMLLLLGCARGASEPKFLSASVAGGLTERLLEPRRERHDKERERQETLAKERLTCRRGKKFRPDQLGLPLSSAKKSVEGRIDAAIGMFEQAENYHALEREYMMHFVQGKEHIQARQNVRKMKPEQRANQLVLLKTQWLGWRNRTEEDKVASLEYHRGILKEAAAIAFEARKEELKAGSARGADDTDVAASLLADVQQIQDASYKALLAFENKDIKELGRLHLQYKRAEAEEWFDAIAAALLGIQNLNKEEEELLKALEDKYDALRDKLIYDLLRSQYGKAEWQELSERERQNELTKRRLLEKKLRREGRLDEAAALLEDWARDKALLDDLMGMQRQQYLAKLRERLRMPKETDRDADESNEELEEAEELTGTSNIFADLQSRFYEEKEALLRRLQEGDQQYLDDGERQAELARLHVEKRRAELEHNFISAALVLGLSERNQAERGEQLKKDRERQQRLAAERLNARREGFKTQRQDTEDKMPAKGDIVGWQEAVIKEVERKHAQERGFLIDLLLDENSEDLREEARTMKEGQRWERLNQLKTKREELDFGLKVDQEEHGAIMEMAVAVKLMIREALALQVSYAESVDRQVIMSAMLADLQLEQDKELESKLLDVKNKSQEELVIMRQAECEARKYEQMDNVATVTFKYEGSGSDDEIIQALDKKYDALMDQLLLDALKKQLSEAEWAALSERERQSRLLKMKLEQKRLLKEGRLDEAAKLLGDGFEVDASLRKLMGENRKKYDELLKERLARRKERLAQGLPPDDDEEEGLQEEGEEDGSITAKDLLANLQQRYDDERDALMARLKGVNDQMMNERQRQAELARLKRERRRAMAEEKFDAAALVLGLAERNQAALEERLKNDRARQEQLAKERLARMRAKKGAKEALDVVRDGNAAELQEAVMKHVEKRQSTEREALLKLLQTAHPELEELAQCSTQGTREARLEELKAQWLATPSDEKRKVESILEELSSGKMVSRRHKLEKVDKAEGLVRDDIIVSLMADLQEMQDKESEEMIQSLIGKPKEDLISVQEMQVGLEMTERFVNVVEVLSSPEKIKMADEEVLMDALQSKYDALKDKLLLEALEKQLGEAEWAALSERERQAKLLKLKLEERRLQREGKYDEAAQLLGDSMAHDKQLQELLGDTRARQQQRLKERLEKRKRRQAEGMSEEEINAIEENEDKAYEEEMQQKSKGNVLQDLQKNFEDEKEALLAAMRGADSKLQSERERQAALARLRREQRKARQEDKFDAAAMVIGMANAQQATLAAKLKSDRERQERLAKERLQARKNKKKLQEPSETQLEDDAVVESNNPVVLQEALLKEMEKKHSAERDLLVQLLDDTAGNEWRQKAKDLDPELRDERLFELKELRSQWRESGPQDSDAAWDEQRALFAEATSLKVEAVLNALKSTEGDAASVSEESAAVKVLADLQDNQDQEAEFLMKDLSSKSVPTLKQLLRVQGVARKGKWYDNVAAALFGFSRLAPMGDEDDFENNLVDALSQKYEALKEKLFVEILKREFGEEEWEQLSEKEQREHLAKLKAQDQHRGEAIANDERFVEMELPSLDAVMGRTREKQEKKLKARMERKKRAKELGIPESEVKLEDEEEEKQESGASILRMLQSQFEDEKEALLATLRGADAKMMNERKRQLALAKLRREEKRIKREDNFDNAAIVFSLAQQNKKMVEASYQSERSRQEQLARERIAARKRRKEAAVSQRKEDDVLNELKGKLIADHRVDKADDLRMADAVQREGTMALQEGLLVEVEKKHSREQETLMELLRSFESNPSACDAASYLNQEQRQERLEILFKERDAWRNASKATASVMPPEDTISESDLESHKERIAGDQFSQLHILREGLALNVAGKKQELISREYPEDSLMEEVSVMVLADLQEKQQSENNALLKWMEDKETTMIQKVKNDQRIAKREGWFDNLSATIFGMRTGKRKASSSRAPGIGDIVELSDEADEEASMAQEEEQAAQLALLKAELEDHKRQLQGLSETDMAAALAELQRQQEAKRQVILAQGNRQREIAKQRMEERKRRLEEKKYEEDVAASLVTMATKRSELLREKTMLNRSKQADSLEERLRKRREDRKRRAEEQGLREQEEERRKKEKEEHSRGEMDSRGVKASLPPGMALKREKTVVQEAAEMEEDKKKEILTFLMHEHSAAAMRLTRERTRNLEMVNKLRSRRKQRIEQREQEAITLIGIGERQKTTLEKHQKEERDRQITTVRERVNRIRYERTMTMREPKLESESRGFESFINSDELNQLSEDERMARVAKEMEKKFRQEGIHLSSVSQEVGEPSKEDKGAEAEPTTNMHGGKLDEKAKEQILKERLAQKKRSRRKEKQSAEGIEE